jgi:hypothetical protein
MKTSSPPSNLRRNLASAIAVVGISVLVFGCATTGGAAETFSLHPPVSIDVRPAGTACPPSWTCWTSGAWTVLISEEPIDTANQASPVEIHWVVIASGWTFDRKGIDFKGRGQWREDKVTDTEWKATSRKDGLIYKYKINLLSPTLQALQWDPTVMN